MYYGGFVWIDDFEPEERIRRVEAIREDLRKYRRQAWKPRPRPNYRLKQRVTGKGKMLEKIA